MRASHHVVSARPPSAQIRRLQAALALALVFVFALPFLLMLRSSTGHGRVGAGTGSTEPDDLLPCTVPQDVLTTPAGDVTPAAWPFLSPHSPQPQHPATSQLLDLSPGRQLFVDDWAVAAADNTAIHAGQAVFQDVVMSAAAGQEQTTSLAAGAVWRDPWLGIHRVWYQCRPLALCLAHSYDGIRWSRWDAWVEQDEQDAGIGPAGPKAMWRSPRHQVLRVTIPAAVALASGRVVLDPRASTPTHRRYVAVVYVRMASEPLTPGFLSTSHDGVSWSALVPTAAGRAGSSAMLDLLRDRWIMHLVDRLFRVHGAVDAVSVGTEMRPVASDLSVCNAADLWHQASTWRHCVAADAPDNAQRRVALTTYDVATGDASSPAAIVQHQCGRDDDLDACVCAVAGASSPQPLPAQQLERFDALGYESMILGLATLSDQSTVPVWSRDGTHFAASSKPRPLLQIPADARAAVASSVLVHADELWIYGTLTLADDSHVIARWSMPRDAFAWLGARNPGAAASASLHRIAWPDGGERTLFLTLQCNGKRDAYLSVSEQRTGLHAERVQATGPVVFAGGVRRLTPPLDLRFDFHGCGVVSFWLSRWPSGESEGVLGHGGRNYEGFLDVPE